MKKFFVFATIMLLSRLALCADWEHLYRVDGRTVYVDREHLTKKGETIRGWFKTVYDEPQPFANKDGQPVTYSSTVDKTEFDCKAREKRLFAVAFYADRVEVAAQILNPPDVRPVMPDTFFDLTLETVCFPKLKK